jgi:hypothetical protein
MVRSEQEQMIVSQSEPEDESPGSPLTVAFRDLSQGSGVYQENLFAVLGKDLPALWHITAEDDEWMVRLKVVWQLERLIEGITGKNEKDTQEARMIARVRFNLLDLLGFRGIGLERRVQRYHQEHQGISESTSGRQMRKLIVPSFEEWLSHGPLPPVPDAVLAVVREAREQTLDEQQMSTIVPVPTNGSGAERGRLSGPRAPVWLVAGTALVALMIGGSAGWLVHGDGNGAIATTLGAGTTNPPHPADQLVQARVRTRRQLEEMAPGPTRTRIASP